MPILIAWEEEEEPEEEGRPREGGYSGECGVKETEMRKCFKKGKVTMLNAAGRLNK